MDGLQEDILSIMHSAIGAVHPKKLMKEMLRRDGSELHIAGKRIDLKAVNRCIVIALGKAAFAMASETEKVLGAFISTGICICKHGHAGALRGFTVIEAGHPTPDEHSVEAAESIIAAVKDLHKEDILIMLISGGASSLVVDLPGGCTLPELQRCFELLVNSGASIHEINVVRKHLSALKGGQLVMKAFPASVYALIISDVLGDDVNTIGSGLTAPDESIFDNAKAILLRYDCWQQLPGSIRTHIENGIAKQITETPKPGDAIFDKVTNRIIGNNMVALHAAAMQAEALGYNVILIDDMVAGNTEEAAERFVETIANYKGKLPACLLMGGETSLHITGKGKGGRNQHFILAALHAWMRKHLNRTIVLLSAGTDGTDGPTDAAGALIDSSILEHEPVDSISVEKHLREFNSYHFFDQLGMLIRTGPTQTNVMDIMIALLADDSE